MSYPNLIHGSEEEIFNSYTTEKIPVGSRMILPDGRVFRLAENAGTNALVIGNLNQGAVPSANFETENLATLAAGVTVLTSVNSTTGDGAVDLFKYGYIWTDNATTLPMMHIKSNTLIANGGNSGTITLFVPTPTAIAAGNTVSYIQNPWRNVIIHASPNTAVLTGVCKIALAVDAYGWLQTLGPCSVQYDTAITIAAVGDPVGVGTTVDGAVSGITDQTDDTVLIVGISLGVVESDAEQTPVFLTIE